MSSRRASNKDDDDDDDSYMGDKLVANPDFIGPTGDRHCTDVLCLLLLLAAWAAMTYIGVYSIQNGDYRLVLYPLDYDGNVCGTDFGADITAYPYLYYVNSWTGGVCVDQCPSSLPVANNLSDIRTMLTYGGLWQTAGAQLDLNATNTPFRVANYDNSTDALFCTDATCFPNNDPAQSWTSQGVDRGNGFAYYVGESYPLLWRCYLTAAANDAIAQAVQNPNATLTQPQDTNDYYAFINKLFGDLWTARVYILGFGFLVALGLAFFYIFLLRLPLLLNAVVWGSIFATIAMVAVAGYYAYNTAQQRTDQDPQVWSDRSIQVTRIAGYVLWGFAAFLFFIMCCMRRQIQLAIGCVKEAGKAIHRMTIIIFVPVLQAAGFIAFMVVLTVYGVWLASLGEITTFDVPLSTSGLEIAFRTYDFDAFVTRCGWYLLFCLFWTGNFIVAVGDVIVSMSVAKWYFTKDKKKIHSGYVLGSIWDTLRYHQGTCAYGSLVLSIIQIFRAMLAKLQAQVKKVNNRCADCILCCFQCCLWCFEKCIRFLNRHAYVQCAIFGTPFCRSAREGFFLVMRNVGRIGSISYVSGAILIVGKLCITVLTTAFSYYAMNESIADELYSMWGPVVFVFLISYFVSDMFLDVFDMGISTVLHCFVADEEMETGFADGSLQKWVDEYED